MASYNVASNICQAPVDGQRLSPCRYECDIEFGFCYDVCVSYVVDDAELQDEFDPFCAARKALAVRDALVLDGFSSLLRVPPAVSQGLSTAPFSMFRNGLLHTGRALHSSTSQLNLSRF
jgi:hypothetical protein